MGEINLDWRPIKNSIGKNITSKTRYYLNKDFKPYKKITITNPKKDNHLSLVCYNALNGYYDKLIQKSNDNRFHKIDNKATYSEILQGKKDLIEAINHNDFNEVRYINSLTQQKVAMSDEVEFYGYPNKYIAFKSLNYYKTRLVILTTNEEFFR